MSSVGFKSPRRKRKQRMILVAMGAAVLIVGGVWALNHFGGPANTNADTTNEAGKSGTMLISGEEANSLASKKKVTPRGSAPKPSLPPAASGANPKADPVVLEMGSPQNPPAPQSDPPKPEEAPKVIDPLMRSPVKPDGQAPMPPPPPTTTPAPAPTPAPAATPASPLAPAARDDAPAQVQQLMAQAERAAKENKLVEARSLLNTAMVNGELREADREGLRRWLTEINETLIFSPTVAAGDPFTETYKVVDRDSLVKIVGKKGLAVETQLIQRVNKMSDPNRLHVGQALKLVRGPFHAVVHKSQFRLDLYAGNPLPPGTAGKARRDGSEEGWTYIRSFPVGLGAEGGTPVGTFLVRQGSKLRNPAWANPRTGQKFEADDPKNPIGEHWLGLLSTDGQKNEGYGLHGTIDPDSIGKEKSMGCVRLGKDDIALIWEMLEDGVSTVRILQ